MGAPHIKPHLQYDILRDDRYFVDHGSCRLHLAGRSLVVMNYSAFGIAIRAPKNHPLKLDLGAQAHAELFLNDIKIDDLQLLKLREEVLTDGQTKIAFEITGDPLNCSKMLAAEKVNDIIIGMRSSDSEWEQLPQLFRFQIGQLLQRLTQMKNKLEGIIVERDVVANDELTGYEDVIITHATRLIGEYFNVSYKEIKPILDRLSKNELALSHRLFRKSLDEIFSLSLTIAPIQDDERNAVLMMDRVEPSIRTGQHLNSTSLFQRSMYRYFLDHPNAKTAKSRSEYLANFLKTFIREGASRGERKRILVYGQSTYHELEILLESLTQEQINRVKFDVIGNHVPSLKFLKNMLRKFSASKGVQIAYEIIYSNLEALVSQKFEAKYDLIYAPSLFNYFSDPVCHVAAENLYSSLGRNGRLILCNYTSMLSASNPIQFLLDWNFIQREGEDLVRIYSPLSKKYEIQQEPEGACLFYIIKRD